MILTRATRALSTLLSCVFACLCLTSDAGAAVPVGVLYQISDFEVTGCAYDPDTPTAKIQVHVYADVVGTIGIADNPCPWFAGSQWENHGFRILLRAPVNNEWAVNVALIGTSGSGADVVWMPVAGAPHVNMFNRAASTFLYQNANYKIGISKLYGAATTEFYNKRVDPSLNLVNPNIGAAFQVALFGSQEVQADGLPCINGSAASPPCIPKDAQTFDCVGTKDFRWNPTQAGSHCGQPDGTWVDNPVWSCTASDPTWCSSAQVSNQAGWIQFFVRWRNFFYPYAPGSWFPYRTYDETFGLVTYRFENDYVQVDWQLWRDGAGAGATNPPPPRGVAFQQLPIMFTVQMTQFIYKKDGVITTHNEGAAPSSDSYYVDGANDGRWMTMVSVNHDPTHPVMTPGDHFTMAVYDKQHAGVCQPRIIGFNTGNHGPGVDRSEHESVFFSVLGFEPVFPNYIESRAMLFPYRHNDVIAGSTSNLGTRIDTVDAISGGFKPSWDAACYQ